MPLPYKIPTLVLILAAFIVVAGYLPAKAATRTVTDATELQDALNTATVGDTILLSNSGDPSRPLNMTVTSGFTGTVDLLTIDGTTISNRVGIISGSPPNMFPILNMGSLSITQIRNIEMNRGLGGLNNGGAVTAEAVTGGFSNAAFRQNVSAGSGGAVRINGSFDGLITNNIHFDSNVANGGSGGGLYVGGNFVGDLAAYSFFDSNTARDGDGGGIYVVGVITGGIHGSPFTSNTAGGSGGGLYLNVLNGSIDAGSNFVGNRATTGSGGALMVTGTAAGAGGDALVGTINASFRQNTAGTNGGAIAVGNNPGTPVNINGNIITSTFSNNTAGSNGGALYVTGAVNGTVSRSSFTDNTAASGGAIYAQTLGSFWNVSFSGNSATGGDGGAIRAGTVDGSIDTNSYFLNNTSTGRGGAIYAANDLTGRIADTLFQGNQATGDGGAIYAGGGNALTFDNASFFENQGANGGAMYRGGVADTVLFTQSSFYHNTATANGGAIYFNTDNGPDDYNVFISVAPNTSTFFINNAANGSGNSFTVGGFNSAVDFNLNIAGDGTVAFYDPFTVAMTGSGRTFTMTMDYSATTLLMSGENTVSVTNGTAEINLFRGNTQLRSDMVNNQDFTMKFEGSTSSSVTLGSGHTLTLLALDARDPNKALFDFNGVTAGNKAFTVQPGTVLDITRILSPLPVGQRYLLVDGMDPASAPNVNNFVYLHPDGYKPVPTLENGDTELWLDLSGLPDAFDPRTTDPNVLRASNCLAGWLNNTEAGLALSPEEVMSLRRNWSSTTAEAYVSAVNLGFDIHSRAMNAANRQAFAQASATDIAAAPLYFSAMPGEDAAGILNGGGSGLTGSNSQLPNESKVRCGADISAHSAMPATVTVIRATTPAPTVSLWVPYGT